MARRARACAARFPLSVRTRTDVAHAGCRPMMSSPRRVGGLCQTLLAWIRKRRYTKGLTAVKRDVRKTKHRGPGELLA